MRISDWSSDVCSSDLKSVPLAQDIDLGQLAAGLHGYSAADCAALLREAALAAMRRNIDAAIVTAEDVGVAQAKVRPSLDPARSEERRVGKECVSTCRSLWSTYHSTKKNTKQKT